jgi:hypothetical protein
LRKSGGGHDEIVVKWLKPLCAGLLVVIVGVGLSGCRLVDFGGAEDDSHFPLLINERRGSYGDITFGSSASDVRRAFGQPSGGDGFFPLDEESFRGPPSIPDRGGKPTLLRYEQVAFLVSPTIGLYAITVTGPEAKTLEGVGIGNSLDAVRAKYGRVRCGEAVAGEPIFGSDVPTYRWCRVGVGRTDVFFGDDPVESVTLTLAR